LPPRAFRHGEISRQRLAVARAHHTRKRRTALKGSLTCAGPSAFRRPLLLDRQAAVPFPQARACTRSTRRVARLEQPLLRFGGLAEREQAPAMAEKREGELLDISEPLQRSIESA